MARHWVALIAVVMTQGYFVGRAVGGPITWSYSSQGEEANGYFLAGQPLTTVQTEPGQHSYLRPYSDFGPRTGLIEERVGLFSARVTITDSASNEAAVIDVPYYFYSTEGGHITPAIFEDFRGQSFQIGRNDYSLTVAGDQQGLYVQVSSGAVQTPEPATLVLVCVGLAGAGAVRLKRRLASRSGQGTQQV